MLPSLMILFSTVIGFLLVLAAWYVLYFTAAQPRAGTLEWIDLYDRTPFVLPGAPAALAPTEALWALAAAVSAALAGAAAHWFLFSTARDAVFACAIPAAGAAALYLLGRLLGVQRAVCMLTAAAVGAACQRLPEAAATLCVSALLAYVWALRPADGGFWRAFLPALGALAAFAVAAVFAPWAVWAGLAYLVLFVLVLAQRWRTGRFGSGKLWRAIVLAVVGAAAFGALTLLGLGLRDGAITPQALVSALGQALADALAHLPDRFSLTLAHTWTQSLLQPVFVLAAGGSAWLVLTVRTLRGRGGAAIFPVLLTAALLPAWLLADAALPAPALLLDLGLLCTHLFERGRKFCAVALPALVLVLAALTALWI